MSFKHYFIFSRTEKIGIFTIFILIVLTVSLPRFIFLNKEKIQIDQDSIIKYLAKQEAPKQEDKSI